MGLGYHDLYEAIRCIFFFGTPHQGLRTVDVVGERTGSQKALIRAQLKEGSEYLENQKEALSRLWGRFCGKVVTFYENKACTITSTALRYPAGLRLTSIVRVRAVRTGRRGSPNGAAIVRSALLAWGILLSDQL